MSMARASWRTGGGGAFEGERYQTTSTLPFPADGKSHDWAIDYDPQANDGRGLLTFRIDERSYHVPLAEGHRQDGAVLDHFGIWNVQTPGDRLEAYLDDVVVDGRKLTFDEDPGWDAVGNEAQFVERLIRPYHDFGYSDTDYAGGAEGEIGGIVFRDEQPTYYGARSGGFRSTTNCGRRDDWHCGSPPATAACISAGSTPPRSRPTTRRSMTRGRRTTWA